MPTRITAKYEIATPMFLGEADQRADTVRPASVKGALRFWWRALNWSRVKQAGDSDEAALRLLHKEESELFGRAAETRDGAQLGGQGQFLLRVVPGNLQRKSATDLNQDKTYKLKDKNNPWHSYLLGLGLMEYEKSIKSNQYIDSRSAIVTGSFQVELFCRNQSAVEAIKPALLAWGLLGGLGSRSRKGFGSVTITELDGEEIAVDRDGFVKELRELCAKLELPTDLPPFTAFSTQAKIHVSRKYDQSPWDALANVGKTMQLFRGYGYKRKKHEKHKINGINVNHTAHSHKKADHDLVYQIAENNTPPLRHPKSLVFGLPRMYGLTHCGVTEDSYAEIAIEPQGMNPNGQVDENNKRSRRASPLFIHVHKITSNSSIIVQAFLPATFLSPNDKIVFKEKQKQKRKDNIVKGKLAPEASPDWTVINEYLAHNDFKDWENVL